MVNRPLTRLLKVANYQKILLDRINGNEQISRYWSKIKSENANGKYTLKRGDAYIWDDKTKS